MTEKRDMKWALELAIASMENPDANWDRKYLEKAADMLKNGGPMVEKMIETTGPKCKKCNTINQWGDHKCSECGNEIWIGGTCVHTKCIKRWTEREKIKIVTEESKPTFEEIK